MNSISVARGPNLWLLVTSQSRVRFCHFPSRTGPVTVTRPPPWLSNVTGFRVSGLGFRVQGECGRRCFSRPSPRVRHTPHTLTLVSRPSSRALRAQQSAIWYGENDLFSRPSPRVRTFGMQWRSARTALQSNRALIESLELFRGHQVRLRTTMFQCWQLTVLQLEPYWYKSLAYW